MDVEHRPEILLGDLFQRRVANIAGVVDENVDAAVVVQRGLDDLASALGCRHGLGARDGLTARSSDLSHDLFGRTGIGAFPSQAAAEIIDDDSCPPRREKQGIGAAEPSACARDDGYAIVESELWHRALLPVHDTRTSTLALARKSGEHAESRAARERR